MNNDSRNSPIRVDSRNCGLVDAVQSGWFQMAADELFVGFPISADDVVVDVGCGEGAATIFCANRGAHVIFTDTTAASIAALRDRVAQTIARKSEGIVSDSCPLPLASECASRVIAQEMLEHVDDPRQVMQELARIGQPGALYLITVPDTLSEKIQTRVAHPCHFQRPNHVRIFEREEFDTLVTNSGLEIITKSYSGFYWSMWILIYWATSKAAGIEFDGPTLDAVNQKPHSPLLDDWARLWHQLIKMPEAAPIKKALDDLLPKNQIIIARKPK